MKNKRSPIRVTIGASLLLVIFVVLCLAAFAALSMASASAEYRLSEKTAQRTSQYYQANNLAQERLAELDVLMASAYASASSEEAYFGAIARTLSEQDDLNITAESADVEIAFSIPVNGGQDLSVVLRAVWPTDQNAPFYELLQWKTVSTVTWEPDDHLPVYIPGS